jgi:hypothetical protein
MPEEEIVTPKEIREIINTVRAFQTAVNEMKSPQQKALEEAMERAMTDKLVNLLTGSSERRETNPWTSITNAFASGLGQAAPQIIDTLVNKLGQERVQKLVDQHLLQRQQQQAEERTESPVADIIRNVDLNNRESVLSAAQSLNIKFQNYENIVNYFRIMKEELALREGQTQQTQQPNLNQVILQLNQEMNRHLDERLTAFSTLIGQRLDEIEKKLSETEKRPRLRRDIRHE